MEIARETGMTAAARRAAAGLLAVGALASLGVSVAGRESLRGADGGTRTGAGTSAEREGAAHAGVCIDVNAADAALLELLPGVGPALAARIVEEREKNGPFRDAEDLERVRGIGPRISAGIAEQAAFGAGRAGPERAGPG